MRDLHVQGPQVLQVQESDHLKEKNEIPRERARHHRRNVVGLHENDRSVDEGDRYHCGEPRSLHEEARGDRSLHEEARSLQGEDRSLLKSDRGLLEDSHAQFILKQARALRRLLQRKYL